jgi:hypothetical protein
MSTDETYRLSLQVQKPDGGETVSVKVEIKVKEGNITGISASGGGKEYTGTLMLKPSDTTAGKSDKESGASAKSIPDTDLCIVCDPVCHVEQC